MLVANTRSSGRLLLRIFLIRRHRRKRLDGISAKECEELFHSDAATTAVNISFLSQMLWLNYKSPMRGSGFVEIGPMKSAPLSFARA